MFLTFKLSFEVTNKEFVGLANVLATFKKIRDFFKYSGHLVNSTQHHESINDQFVAPNCLCLNVLLIVILINVLVLNSVLLSLVVPFKCFLPINNCGYLKHKSIR